MFAVLERRLIQLRVDCMYDTENSSSHTVLTATLHSYGNGQNSISHRFQTP